MGDDHRHFLVGFAYAACIATYHGARIERMKQSSSLELRDAAYLYFRKHLVCHRRIGDIGTADALYALFSPGLVDLYGNIISDERAQIAGMDAVLA